jgi:hypothetical protein
LPLSPERSSGKRDPFTPGTGRLRERSARWHALWLVLGENMFFLVAIGAAYQAFFARDLPAHPSRVITAYFIAVMTGLGILMRILPGQGFGAR